MKKDLIKLFWSKTRILGDCLIYGSGKPYGCFRKIKTYRFAYLITHGTIPKHSVIRHTCDNPACVKPEHLVLGSQSQNLWDMRLRGRQKQTMSISDLKNEDYFLTVSQAKKMLEKNGIKRHQVWFRNEIMLGSLKSEKIGTSRVIYKTEIIRLINTLKANRVILENMEDRK